MSQLSSRLDDLDKNLTYRLDAITEGISKSNASNSSGKNGKEKEGKSSSSAPPTPSALFNQAYGDYTRRKYDAAMGGFQVYLEKYGDTAKASEAQYYIGESQFAKGDWWKALEAYDAVLVNHGKSNIAPSAYIQKGVTLEKLNKESEAMAVYDAIVRKYPNRKEAQTAKARLDALKGGAAEESPR